ncbi:MazG-like family protein [Macrococcus equipercicus]|uniref:MazG-like family protein n=1 Tax=Macrococcus equipercicus TaxID=69967 RepID=A0A9Q9F2M4_9STAP|nr:MazG-like family protein [Macrococcus equipercicus]UTH14935.1 MazG-like family protein [Macrococcus equipercicus]
MNNLEKLTEQIEQWAIDRNLHTADPRKQMLKLGEETGELYSGMAKGNEELIKDSIGDAYVVITILSMQKNFSISEFVDSVEESTIKDDAEMALQFSLALMLRTGSLAHSLKYSNDTDTLKMMTHWFIETLFDLAYALNVNYIECVQMAYDEIKDRKGKMIDGVFVKESDLVEVTDES